jgi:multidrug efflux system outer membrane protein
MRVSGSSNEGAVPLRFIGRLRIQADSLRDSAQASKKATSPAQLRYQRGVSDFLTVLDAERTMLQAQDQPAQSETATAASLAAVYKALRGDWPMMKDRTLHGGSGHAIHSARK